MGGKRKIAHKILNKIVSENKHIKYFYDLFGGGGAVSFLALQYSEIDNVVYNELNTGVVELLKDIKKNGITEKYYKWVDRETFKKHKDDNDWYGGLIKTVWSFGNNQKGYLFGKPIEKYKKLLHEIVVYKNRESLKKFNQEFNLNFKIEDPENLFNFKESINDRRLKLTKYINKNINKKYKKISIIKNSFNYNLLQQLQRLQQLERLERLQQLEIYNKSYDKIKIKGDVNETIIYCDPPYKDTGSYQKELDHDKFLNWVKNNKYKVYVSSYEMDLPCILEIEHNTTLSAIANNKVIERLFINKK